MSRSAFCFRHAVDDRHAVGYRLAIGYRLAVGILACAFALSAQATDDVRTVTSTTVGDGYGESRIFQTCGNGGYFWEGNEEANQPNVAYICIGQSRTPTTNSVFVGHSYQIGDDTHVATLPHKGAGSKITWMNEGLFLYRGSWQSWDIMSAANPGTFAGTVTVMSPRATPFGIYPTPDATQKGAYFLRLEGDFRAAAGTSAYVSDNTTKNYTNDMDLVIAAATTNYFGELVAKSNGYITISGSDFSGSLVVEGGGRLTLTNKCLTVGSLSLNENSSATAYLTYEAQTDTLTPLTITNALNRDFLADPVRIVVPVAQMVVALTSATGSQTITLVRTTGESALDLTDYDFKNLESLPEYARMFVGPVLSEDGKSIVINVSDYIKQRAGDTSLYTSLSNIVTDVQTPTNWTDNLLPHAGAAYLTQVTLRTSPSESTSDTTHIDVFPGERLLVQGGAVALKSAGFSCPDLIFYGGSLNAYGTPNRQRVLGKITIRPSFNKGQNYTTFLSQNGRELSIEADLHARDGKDSDSTKCVLSVFSEGNSNVATPITFSGDNRHYLGRISVSGTSEAKYPVMVVSNVTALGGSPAAVDGEAIIVKNYGKLLVQDTIDFDIPNRYLYVCATGRVGVAEGRNLRVATRMKMSGHFWKEDPGTLELAGSIGFGSSNSGTPTDGVNNFLDVKEGYLKVSHVRGVDGARITLASGTAMLVDFAPTGEMATRGIVNVKTDVPFTSEAEDGKVRFVFDQRATTLSTAATVPICTVTATAAETLKNTLVLAKPQGLHVSLLEPVTNSDGTVTFRADVRPLGLSIMWR